MSIYYPNLVAKATTALNLGRDFNAFPDGSDASDALEDALNSGRPLYIPGNSAGGGFYGISRTIVIDPATTFVALFSDVKAAALLYRALDDAFTGAMIRYSGTELLYFDMSHITFDGRELAQATPNLTRGALNIENIAGGGRDFRITECGFTAWGNGYGVEVFGFASCHLADSQLWDQGGDDPARRSVYIGGCGDITLRGNQFANTYAAKVAGPSISVVAVANGFLNMKDQGLNIADVNMVTLASNNAVGSIAETFVLKSDAGAGVGSALVTGNIVDGARAGVATTPVAFQLSDIGSLVTTDNIVSDCVSASSSLARVARVVHRDNIFTNPIDLAAANLKQLRVEPDTGAFLGVIGPNVHASAITAGARVAMSLEGTAMSGTLLDNNAYSSGGFSDPFGVSVHDTMATLDHSVLTNPATAGFALTPRVSANVQQLTGVLTADATVTLDITHAVRGDWFLIISTATHAFSHNIDGLKTITTGQYVRVEFNGTSWFESAFGTL